MVGRNGRWRKGAEGNGESKQTLIGARPPMFTGLPAIPTSLARWFLVDQGGS